MVIDKSEGEGGGRGKIWKVKLMNLEKKQQEY